MADTKRVLKISVLATNAVLVDGESKTLASLRDLLQAQANTDTIIWYYRENPSNAAPAAALEVLRIIADCRLPVRLCLRSDFSDNATGQAVQAFIHNSFLAARQQASQRRLAVVRKDGEIAVLPAPKTATPQMVNAVEGILPSKNRCNIAVIAETVWADASAPKLKEADKAIPFFGMLMGFTFIGHAVWVFDGSGSSLRDGCAESDVLIVDSERVPFISDQWELLAKEVMRSRRIMIFDRNSRRLIKR